MTFKALLDFTEIVPHIPAIVGPLNNLLQKVLDLNGFFICKIKSVPMSSSVHSAPDFYKHL